MLKGVLLDLDGTLTEPNLDFAEIREAIGLGEGPVLESLEAQTPPLRKRGFRILERYEKRAAEEALLREGCRELLAFLQERSLKRGIITRNSRSSAEIVMRKYRLSFDCIVTREDAPPKPSREPVLLAGRLLGVEPQELLVVGDYKFDIISGKRAGAGTVLLLGEKPAAYAELSDHCICSLVELIPLLQSMLD